MQYHDHIFNVTRTFGKRTFRLVMYRAYNAMGLIGYENNGIAVLDEDRMAVVVDGITPAVSGYSMPTPQQTLAWQMLTTCSWSEFQEFCDNHKNSRGPLRAPRAKKAPELFEEFAYCLANTPGYDDQAKARWAAVGCRFFARLQKELGGTVSYNPAGIACSGDFTLRSGTLFVCINADWGSRSQGYYRREVGSRYGVNNTWDAPRDEEEFQRLVRSMRACKE